MFFFPICIWVNPPTSGGDVVILMLYRFLPLRNSKVSCCDNGLVPRPNLIRAPASGSASGRALLSWVALRRSQLDSAEGRWEVVPGRGRTMTQLIESKNGDGCRLAVTVV